MEDTSPRVVLITGAGRGIGAGLARAFAAAGYRVAVNDVDRDRAEAVAGELRAGGTDALSVPADVSDETAVAAMVAAVAEALGTIDVLVNNAYWRRPGGSSAETMNVADFDLTMRVAVYGAFFCSRAVFPYMRDRGGRIVNLGSEGSESAPLVGMADYVCAKSGVRALSKALARDWAR